MQSCGGCRTCEMACSFRLAGEFAPSSSGIRILERDDGLGFDVRFVPEGSGNGPGCDGCPELDEPMCVQHCEKGEDLWVLLRKFLEKSTGENP